MTSKFARFTTPGGSPVYVSADFIIQPWSSTGTWIRGKFGDQQVQEALEYVIKALEQDD